MIPRCRLFLGAAAAALAAAALAGCGTTQNGLASGAPAPSVSVQPTPEAVWPSWSGSSSKSPAADTTEHQPPPQPLKNLDVPSGGLGQLQARDVLRADPRMKQYADRPHITKPGRAGIRPAKLEDLTGDGTADLLLAVDTESGRTALAAYTERNGKVYPILFATGKRVTIETVGSDLVLRSPCADGGEQAVRYHWDGARMTTASDTKTYRKGGGPVPVPEATKDLESPPPTSDRKSPDPSSEPEPDPSDGKSSADASGSTGAPAHSEGGDSFNSSPRQDPRHTPKSPTTQAAPAPGGGTGGAAGPGRDSDPGTVSGADTVGEE
ncbi:hypothetical protein P8605_43260 [Streptomyces sp. T-3]|nr:hypothetical protein [Streptomyces sp. T-3]